MSEAEAHEVGDFECNICFDLAQEPVITLCGHLHCWSCLYKWLQFHSHSHECPVCKALIDEEKLIPLYGRGKTPTDPRLKTLQGVVEIPGRPAGRRPETAPSFEANNVDNIGIFAGFGGVVLSPVLGVQFNGFSYGSAYGGLSGHDYGYLGSLSEGGLNSETSQGNGENLKRILFYILVFVFFAFLTM